MRVLQCSTFLIQKHCCPHGSPPSQIIFRKIADVKKERERQRNDVTLSIPEDHPVRKLFQRFRQQRDAQPSGDSQAYCDHNCVQVEPQRHLRSNSNSYTQCQSTSPQQQEYSSPVQTHAPCVGGGSTGGAAPPQVFTFAEESEENCTKEAGESISRPCGESRRASSRGAGAGGAAGGVTGGRGARGWAKFRNTALAVPPPPASQEHQPQKAEEWPKGSQSSEQLAVANKKRDSEEAGGAEGSNSAGDAGEEKSALHKTDSCDSGITKSDLRIDRAGSSRSSFERSPMEKSPVERNPFERSLGVDALKHSFVPPTSEQTLLQATLQEAKLELKEDIQILSGRLSALESQVGEILRLLSIKRRLSLPPSSSPKARLKGHDSLAASKPVDDGPF